MISFPCTTKLSFDFLRSSVSISERNQIRYVHIEALTMTAELEVKDIAHFYIHDSQETLIFALEFALVEYLHCDDRRVLHGAAEVRRHQTTKEAYISKLSFQ
jgi:hypothetical protein